MDNQDFRSFAKELVGQEVEVITSEGTYTGTLLSVGSDTIIMRARIRGRLVRLLIRIALITALFRLVLGTRGSVWSKSSEHDSGSSSFNKRGGFW